MKVMLLIPKLTDTQKASFNARLKVVRECWVWQGGRNKAGYGQMRIGKPQFGAHRIAYFLATGVNPVALNVCHKCDNPPCCNPSHLFLGTTKDNRHDCIEKGRWPCADMIGSLNPNAILTETEARIIRHSKASGKSLAARYGISESLVSGIKTGKLWTHA